jgi:cytochrome P450
MLARMELKALFAKILPHLASVEQAGDSALTKSGFVSGVKRLPIRYTLR